MKVFDKWSEPKDGLQFPVYRGAKISELARAHPMRDVIESGGAKLHPWGGNPDASVSFDKYDKNGLITIKIGNESTIIQKDELVMVIRYAMGRIET